MKLLIKKIFKSNLGIHIRNLLNIYPIKINTNNLEKNFSISDSFIWRTDKSYETVFKFKDVLNFFYGDNTNHVDLKFFSKNGQLLKSINNLNINVYNDLIIDKKFMDGIEDYGTFSIYHKSPTKHQSIRNSCYTGFSFKKKSHVYVHGNIPTTAKLFDNSDRIFVRNIIGKTLFSNQNYKIQNQFDDSDYIELFIHNPCSSSIRILIDNCKFSLKSNSSSIIKLTKKEIDIQSNCYLLRPIIFNYKNNVVDVFHG